MSRSGMNIHRPFDGFPVTLAPAEAGWTYSGLQVLQLPADGSVELELAGEAFALPLSGGYTVDIAGGETFTLHGRESVFAGTSDFAYIGRDTRFTLHSPSGGEIALPSARCDTKLPARYGAAADVAVETRGAGASTRQVRNFGTPEGWPHAERLMCCELITPPGNWSSYPPHKHDRSAPCAVANEEIYYYRIDGAGGFGLHRTYTDETHEAAGLQRLDETLVVRDGDVVLIPYGYHGPCAAAPGYPMYYLNVLAGPGKDRSMDFCDDPAHAWIRASWTAEAKA